MREVFGRLILLKIWYSVYFKILVVEVISLFAYFIWLVMRRSFEGRFRFLSSMQAWELLWYSIIVTRIRFWEMCKRFIIFIIKVFSISNLVLDSLEELFSRKIRFSSLLQQKSCRGGFGVFFIQAVVGSIGFFVGGIFRTLVFSQVLYMRLTLSQ